MNIYGAPKIQKNRAESQAAARPKRRHASQAAAKIVRGVPDAQSKSDFASLNYGAPKNSTREIRRQAQERDARMSGPWQPEKYRDEYRDDLLKLIEKKIKSGRTKIVEPAEAPAARKPAGKVIDIMHLLKQSVDQRRRKSDRPRKRKAG